MIVKEQMRTPSCPILENLIDEKLVALVLRSILISSRNTNLCGGENYAWKGGYYNGMQNSSCSYNKKARTENGTSQTTQTVQTKALQIELQE